jgi:hypothetical protein
MPKFYVLIEINDSESAIKVEVGGQDVPCFFVDPKEVHGVPSRFM